jgi:exopolysaccharide biosynthesis polyprenyl glycosylphosphotransferase
MNDFKEPDPSGILWQAKDIGTVNLALDIRKANLALDIRASNLSLRWRTLIVGLQLVTLIMLDISMIFTSWVLADFFIGAKSELSTYSPMLPMLAVDIGILTVSGFYGADEKLNRLAKLFQSITVAQIVLLTIAFFYKPKLWALHSVIFTAWPLNFAFIGGARFLFHLSMMQIRMRIPLFQNSIALIGHQVDIERVRKLLRRSQQFRVDSVIDLASWDMQSQLEQILHQVRSRKVSEVFVCSPNSIDNQIILFWNLKASGIHLRIVPTELQLPQRASETKMIEEIHTTRFNSLPFVGINFWLKRAFDLTASSMALVLLSPLLVMIAITISLSSPGPIFYKQYRVGLKGRRFQVWKFRTMVNNASELQHQLEAQNEVQGGVLFKIKNDPRITKFGKFLRDYSLDELPQLINVLQGQMSIVGPRPLAIRDYELSMQEAEQSDRNRFLRYEVLPGITGLWQVKGRKDTSSGEIFYWDTIYILQWSLALDLKIVLETIKVVLFKEGAC